jgi:hypothetical protein
MCSSLSFLLALWAFGLLSAPEGGADTHKKQLADLPTPNEEGSSPGLLISSSDTTPHPHMGATYPCSQNNLPWLSKIILTGAISNSLSYFINNSQSLY